MLLVNWIWPLFSQRYPHLTISFSTPYPTLSYPKYLTEDPLLFHHMQRLYYSDDGVKPSTFLQHLLVGDKAYVQRIQMVLGLLYTFTLVPPACPKLEYKFTVTRDRNKQYHMYQYTHSYTGMTQEVSGLKVGKTCKHFYEQQQTTEESCGQTSEKSCVQTSEESCEQTSEESLMHSCNKSNRQSSGQSYTDHNNMFSVATYNIWNLNSLPGEEYEDRLERLGKVSGYPLHIG